MSLKDDFNWYDFVCPDCNTTTSVMEHDKDNAECAKCALESITTIDEEEFQELNCKECGDRSLFLMEGTCNTCLSKKNPEDNIDWPKHYNTGKIQPIDAIEDWKLDFRLANAVKYIARHKHKGKAKNDLEKAVWYIQRYIDKEFSE
jgi:hypothetical protein